MAKFIIGKGLDDYTNDLKSLNEEAGRYIGQAIYEGAKIVTDQVRKEIDSLPVQNGPVKRGERRNPTKAEVDGLREGLGIAKKRIDNDFVHVKVGMDGYNSHVTQKYPKGHPNAMVARSIEAGTTYMNRIPFIRRAVNATRAEAEEKMREIIEQGISEKMQ